MKQITIKSDVTISGIGLHSGKIVNVKLLPAEPNTGIIFKRVDIDNSAINVVRASYSLVKDTSLNTMLINDFDVKVGTIEHLMSAIAWLKIDNLIIEIDAPEVPILDGSSIIYLDKIKQVGLVYQDINRKTLKIIRSKEVITDKWTVKFVPSESLILNVSIDFAESAIGKQDCRFDFSNDDYYTSIAKARTFVQLKDVEYLKSVGLAQGGSLENAVVVDGNNVLNPEGLRFSDECVRHKVLDAIGDLYLSGYNIKGEFFGCKSGHGANNMLLRAIFSDPTCYAIEDDYSGYNISVLVKHHSASEVQKF